MVKTVLLSYFDMATKEFLQTRATVVDDSDPSVDYIPYNATEVIAPDKTTWPAHTSPVFNGTSWDTVPDYRGVTFYHHLTQETKEYGLGESPDTSLYTDVAPSDSGTIWNSSSRTWSHTVDGHRISKITELVKAYNDALYTPFDTGVKAMDLESKVQVPVLASIVTGATANSDGFDAYSNLINSTAYYANKEHDILYQTADGKTVIVSASNSDTLLSSTYDECARLSKKLSSLLARVATARTIEAINEIVW